MQKLISAEIPTLHQWVTYASKSVAMALHSPGRRPR